jgi:hypothetical protein
VSSSFENLGEVDVSGDLSSDRTSQYMTLGKEIVSKGYRDVKSRTDLSS